MVVASSSLSRSFSVPPTEVAAAAACHARSSSLPCGSHPILSQLKDQMQKLEVALAASFRDPAAINLLTGLRMLKTLYDMVDSFVQLPQVQEAMHHHENWANLLLEDLLKFLDAFGVMAATLSSLKEINLTTLISLRRREPNSVESSLQSFVNYRKTASKEMGKLVAVLKTMAKPSGPLLLTIDEVETVAVFNGVKSLTVSAAVSVASALMCLTPRKVVERLMAMPRRQVPEAMKEMNEADCAMDCALRACAKGDHTNDEVLRVAVERMVVLEDRLNGLERENESIFRGLISTRVSILNILTQ
ncbi:uncharacterized protein LOC116247563 [Nymphaea colorata]|uniref:uncharacterized protein LOC116247563 n=1 Tax=Nymphaea colorata TaxID=210225 RepID=UPI00129E835C|nr:uncharacterized protein LOC116247563 [Nymphaea colorata]